ncbi:WhiB family transcriptional regulator [Streptomyces sp. PCS3-D2]|uniref:WhiB family transcriptional regulator n=1 Tax=Streptomyces sp. PCS3-D2 TaxID=1460244 RepID=UPI00044606A4|nr:WhiB family transcriptional regulator [Streptomyces sp. PCS3-D2]WKV74748.1 WhiB family transcriptional regulator [Streptomyces sp. PCS3-D2]
MSTLVSNPRSRPHADTDPATDWAALGACVGKLQDFHSSDTAAKDLCADCPVRLRCLDQALREEGTTPPGYRSDIRGGLTPSERAALSGYQRPAAPTGGRITGDMEQAERLLREGLLSNEKVSDATGVGRHTVSQLRRDLGLPTHADLRGTTPAERLAHRTRPGPDDHLLWTGDEGTVVGGRRVKGVRLAFEVGHGRLPDGTVKRTCDVDNCVAWQHLTDRQLRDALAAPTPPAPAVPAPVEYLYDLWDANWDDGPAGNYEIRRHPITKKTPQRISFTFMGKASYVDRQHIEAHGEAYHRRLRCLLYLAPPELPTHPEPASLQTLRQAMADAHPDRGGTDTACMTAHTAYQEARRRAGV